MSNKDNIFNDKQLNSAPSEPIVIDNNPYEASFVNSVIEAYNKVQIEFGLSFPWSELTSREKSIYIKLMWEYVQSNVKGK